MIHILEFIHSFPYTFKPGLGSVDCIQVLITIFYTGCTAEKWNKEAINLIKEYLSL